MDVGHIIGYIENSFLFLTSELTKVDANAQVQNFWIVLPRLI